MSGRRKINGTLGLIVAVLAAYVRVNAAEPGNFDKMTGQDPQAILASLKEEASRDKTPIRAVPASRQPLKAWRLSEFYGPDAKFASYCEVGDWFYSNFMHRDNLFKYPYTALYRDVAAVTEGYFKKGCGAVNDAASQFWFLESLHAVCDEACGKAVARHGWKRAVAEECSQVCALDIETLSGLRLGGS